MDRRQVYRKHNQQSCEYLPVLLKCHLCSSLVLLLVLCRARNVCSFSAFSVSCGVALFACCSCSPAHLPARRVQVCLQLVTICCYTFPLISSPSFSHHSMLFGNLNALQKEQFHVPCAIQHCTRGKGGSNEL